MSTADRRIIARNVCDRDDVRLFFDQSGEQLRALGMEFARYSFKDDDPSCLQAEGWLKQPRDQGPVDWTDPPDPHARRAALRVIVVDLLTNREANGPHERATAHEIAGDMIAYADDAFEGFMPDPDTAHGAAFGLNEFQTELAGIVEELEGAQP